MNFSGIRRNPTRSVLELDQLQVDVDNMTTGLSRWCKTHYGKAYVAWMHAKVIQVFVESVLRYGLPVDFTDILFKAHTRKELQLVDALKKSHSSGVNKQEAGMDDDGDKYYEFVLLKFNA